MSQWDFVFVCDDATSGRVARNVYAFVFVVCDMQSRHEGTLAGATDAHDWAFELRAVHAVQYGPRAEGLAAKLFRVPRRVTRVYVTDCTPEGHILRSFLIELEAWTYCTSLHGFRGIGTLTTR